MSIYRTIGPLVFVAVGKIPFKLACNEDIHNILIEFDSNFRQIPCEMKFLI